MNEGITQFNETMAKYLAKDRRYFLSHPAHIRMLAKVSRNIRRQAKVRGKLQEKENLVVPPVLILSVTNECNLSCAGCYAHSQQRDAAEEMSIDDIRRTVDEAVALGVCVVLVAGGEPLMKEGLLDIPQKHPGTLFVMFTNGLLLTSETLYRMQRMKNLIPVISLEGDEAATDARRGKGMYRAVMQIMNRLNERRSLFGASITITSSNFDDVISAAYMDDLKSAGCRIVFLIEYVPTDDNDFDLCLTDAQKKRLIAQTEKLIEAHDMLVVPLPGDEDKYGGCLAAGRGFLHISSTGSLEACPFAPFADTNVQKMPLKNALQSKLLREIRDNHHLLRESRGGCALQENQDWVKSLMREEL